MKCCVALAALLVALCAAAPAGAAPLHACGKHLECGVVSAPLDPSGATPGTVRLAVERYTPTGSDAAGTILALAGGPGQSSIDVLGLFQSSLAGALQNRSLVVFDPRGVGASGPLSCPAATSAASCAQEIGPSARYYSTAENVADMEAVRAALSISSWTVYGVSYGTYTGLAYARAYPSHVTRLMLDSVVPPDNDPPVQPSVFNAIRRLYGQGCEVGCPGLTPLQSLSQALLTADPDDAALAYVTLRESDFSPLLRAEIPMAFHLFAEGDHSALLHVASLAGGAGSTAPATLAGAANSIDEIDTIATRCEDISLPWAEGASADVAGAAGRAAFETIAPSLFAPFDSPTIFQSSDYFTCAGWPYSGSNPPRETAPLPSVPTLLLSGVDDIRTPMEDAATLAAQLPDATLVTVPNVGHAVLVSDTSGCAYKAVNAFLAGETPAQCQVAATPAPVDPLPPASLAAVAPAAPLSGTAGRVLRAVELTLHHDIGLGAAEWTAGGFTFGTAGGDAIAGGVPGHLLVELTRLSYMPGVALSGTLQSGSGRYLYGAIEVRLPGRGFGVVKIATNGRMSGTLGGHRFSISAAARMQLLGALAGLPAA